MFRVLSDHLAVSELMLSIAEAKPQSHCECSDHLSPCKGICLTERYRLDCTWAHQLSAAMSNHASCLFKLTLSKFDLESLEKWLLSFVLETFRVQHQTWYTRKSLNLMLACTWLILPSAWLFEAADSYFCCPLGRPEADLCIALCNASTSSDRLIKSRFLAIYACPRIYQEIQ